LRNAQIFAKVVIFLSADFSRENNIGMIGMIDWEERDSALQNNNTLADLVKDFHVIPAMQTII